MADYKTLHDYKIYNATLKDANKFEKERIQCCHSGFDVENCEIIYAGNKIVNFDFENTIDKFYDEENFIELLKNYLKSGYVLFSFSNEYGDEWDDLIFPGLLLDNDFNYLTVNELLNAVKKQKPPKSTVECVVSLYKEYLIKTNKHINENLKELEKVLEE